MALREKDRGVRFCSRDFTRVSETPDSSCRVGPLVSEEIVHALHIITGLIVCTGKNPIEAETAAAALCLPPEYAPDIGVFKEGFQIFFNRHRSFIKRRTIRSAVLRLGAILWQQRQAEKEAARNEAADFLPLPPDQASETGWVWTPDAVSDAIEGRIERGAFYFRRGRWFVMLSEALVSWHSRDRSAAQKHIILFDRGRIHRIGRVAVDDPLPIPPGFRRSRRDRLGSFDLITYDRMRVVTTELRRLVSEGRDVEVRLGKSAFLQNDALAKVLRWV